MSRMLRLAAASSISVMAAIGPASIFPASAADDDDHSYLPPSMRAQTAGAVTGSPSAQLANASASNVPPSAIKDRHAKTDNDGGFLSHIFGRQFRFAWDR